MQADSNAVSALLGLLGIVLQDLSVLVGINCTPITVSDTPVILTVSGALTRSPRSLVLEATAARRRLFAARTTNS